MRIMLLLAAFFVGMLSAHESLAEEYPARMAAANSNVAMRQVLCEQQKVGGQIKDFFKLEVCRMAALMHEYNNAGYKWPKVMDSFVSYNLQVGQDLDAGQITEQEALGKKKYAEEMFYQRNAKLDALEAEIAATDSEREDAADAQLKQRRLDTGLKLLEVGSSPVATVPTRSTTTCNKLGPMTASCTTTGY